MEAKIFEEKPTLSDGMENLVAQLGTGQDKRSYSSFVNHKRLSQKGNQEELNALYRTDWIAGKIVDIIPDDMTREWRSFTGDITPEQVKQLISEEERLNLKGRFNQAHKWSRLYGTAIIVMSIDDGGLPEEPLNIDRIKPGGLRHINVVDSHRLSVTEIEPIQDPLNVNFGMPEWYRFSETNVRIHHSRIIRFDGIKLPFDEFRRNNYFSDGVLDRLYDSITNFHTTTNSAASMVYETNIDVMKVKGLMSYLQTAEGEAMLRKRFTLAGLMKSFNNMLLLDSEEDFQPKTNTFSGLPELIDRYAQILSAASDVPATRLLGTSASGLNATGEGDLKNYYDKVRSHQMVDYKPRLDYFDTIMAKSLQMDNLDLTYQFNPLFQMTPQEEAALEFQNAQRDQIYYNIDAIPVSTITKELKQEGVYSNIDDDYIEELEAAERENEIDFDTDTNGNQFGTEQSTEEREEEEGESSSNTEES